MSAHTTSPWSIEEPEDGDAQRNHIAISAPDNPEATCVSEEYNDCKYIALCLGPDREANARLIAAAPELLVVCKSIALELTQHGDIDKNGYIRIDLPSEDVMALRDAIARAADT